MESNKEHARMAVAAGGTVYSISAIGPEDRSSTATPQP
jgi:hypothetical protein